MCVCLTSHQKRVFETVRNVNQVVKQRSMTPSPMNIPGSNQSSAMNSLISSCISTPRSSFYGGDISNIVIDNKTNSIILETDSENGSVLWHLALWVFLFVLFFVLNSNIEARSFSFHLISCSYLQMLLFVLLVLQRSCFLKALCISFCNLHLFGNASSLDGIKPHILFADVELRFNCIFVVLH